MGSGGVLEERIHVQRVSQYLPVIVQVRPDVSACFSRLELLL